MKARFSSTTALLLVLAGVSAWYFGYEQSYKLKLSESESLESSLLPFKKTSITELIIHPKKGEPIHLKRGNAQEDWSIISPVSDKADQPVISSLVDTLTASKKDRVIQDAPSDLKPFGLSEPSFKLAIIQDLEHQVELLFGDSTQVGSGVYFKFASKPSVLKTNKGLLTAFQKNLFELRNKQLLSLASQALNEIKIETSGKQVIFKKDSQSNWTVGGPGSMPSFRVDVPNFSKLESQLSGLKAKAVFSESLQKDMIRLFESPQVFITLSSADVSSREELRFISFQDKLLVKAEGRNPVYEIDKSLLTSFSLPEDHYREKQILRFDRKLVSTIRISHQGKTFKMVKDKDQWRFEPPTKEQTLDPDKVDKLMDSVQDLQLKEFLSDKAQLKLVSVIEFLDSNQQLIGKLELGAIAKGLVRGKSSYQKLPWNMVQEILGLLDLKQTDFVKQKEKADESVTH